MFFRVYNMTGLFCPQQTIINISRYHKITKTDMTINFIIHNNYIETVMFKNADEANEEFRQICNLLKIQKNLEDRNYEFQKFK